jgi:hypothetical protein
MKTEMRKVLILGLYYPPANFMAGRRLEGWARHLPSFGYEPHVLTRYYDPEERDRHDFYASSRPTRTLIEPWIESDRVTYTRFETGLWTRAPLPGIVRGLGHYLWPDPDHSVWFRQCREYLEQTNFRPDLIIASVKPAGVLRIARKLAAWLRVPWLADFRDLWIEQFEPTVDTRFKYFLQRRHLQSAAGITVVADDMVNALRRQLAPLEKPIRLIYNGAEPTNGTQPDPADYRTVEIFRGLLSRGMVLTYAGTLYPAQEIDRFLDAVEEFQRRTGRTCTVVLCGRHEREKYTRWPFVHVLDPVSHSTAIFMLKQSTALFYPTWPQRYSGFSGKVFEQILSGRPVLVSFQPSADLEALSGRFNSLIITREPEALIKELGQLPQMSAPSHNGNVPVLATKKYWAGQLAGFLDEILDR